MQIQVAIGSEVFEGTWVEFPNFPLTCVIVLKTLALPCQRVISNTEIALIT